MPKRTTRGKLPEAKKLVTQPGDWRIRTWIRSMEFMTKEMAAFTETQLETDSATRRQLTTAHKNLSLAMAGLQITTRRTVNLPLECWAKIIWHFLQDKSTGIIYARLVCRDWRNLVDENLRVVTVRKVVPDDFSRFRSAYKLAVGKSVIRNWDRTGQAMWERFVESRPHKTDNLELIFGRYLGHGYTKRSRRPESITVDARGAALVLRRNCSGWVSFKKISALCHIDIGHDKALAAVTDPLPSCTVHNAALDQEVLALVVSRANYACFRVWNVDPSYRHSMRDWRSSVVHFVFTCSSKDHPENLGVALILGIQTATRGPYEVHVWSYKPKLLKILGTHLLETLGGEGATVSPPATRWHFFFHSYSKETRLRHQTAPQGSITYDMLYAKIQGPKKPWDRQSDLV